MSRVAQPRNALRREIVYRASVPCRAPAEAVYDLLADLTTHLEWAGRRQPKAFRLLSLEAPPGPATAGTEFTSTGADGAARFSDRSVVTEATRPTVFEFVTESRRQAKGGRAMRGTVATRYEITPAEGGSRVDYTSRWTEADSLSGTMALFRVPGLHWILNKVSAAYQRRGVRQLVAMAEEATGIAPGA